MKECQSHLRDVYVKFQPSNIDILNQEDHSLILNVPFGHLATMALEFAKIPVNFPKS